MINKGQYLWRVVLTNFANVSSEYLTMDTSPFLALNRALGLYSAEFPNVSVVEVNIKRTQDRAVKLIVEN